MGKRDPIQEVLDVKSRRRDVEPDDFSIHALEGPWLKMRGTNSELRNYFPIRLVTILEVFARNVIATLIDHGPPFNQNAADLLRRGGDGKFDFPTVLSLQGRTISLGEYVAHGVSLNRIDDVVGVLGVLTGTSDFLRAIEQVHDRFAVERHGRAKTPIIGDLRKMRSALARLFTTRHILAHELPAESPFTDDDVDSFFAAAVQFTHATSQHIQTLRFGEYPLTTMDILGDIGSRVAAAEAELEEVTKAARARMSHSEAAALDESQTTWSRLMAAQETLAGAGLEGGSYQPVAHVLERLRGTRSRVEQLRWWVTRADNELWNGEGWP